MSITGWVIVAIIVVLALWAITSYNGLVALRFARQLLHPQAQPVM